MRGRCTAHQRQATRARPYDAQRGNSTQRGYGAKWQGYRRSFLRTHPLCVNPYALHADLIAATVVDHITPHKGDARLFWLKSNHQALCKRCHDTKTVRHDGGLGHKPTHTLASCSDPTAGVPRR